MYYFLFSYQKENQNEVKQEMKELLAKDQVKQEVLEENQKNDVKNKVKKNNQSEDQKKGNQFMKQTKQKELINDVQLIWVDSNINNKQNLQCQVILESIFRKLICLESIWQFKIYLQQIISEKSTYQYFLLVSGSFGEEIMKFIGTNSNYILYIFVYCGVPKYHKIWVQKYPNVKVLTSSFQNIVKSLKEHYKSLGFINLDHKSAFHFTDREALLNHLFISSLMRLMSKRYQQNQKRAKKEVQKFSENYIHEFRNPKKIQKDLQDLNNLMAIFEQDRIDRNIMIYYYTKETFLYRMINNTIRKGNLLHIFQIRFFIYRLYYEINMLQSNHKEQITLYRGFCVDSSEINLWRTNLNYPLLFQGFTSTSYSKELAIKFMQLTYDQIQNKKGVVKVLFQFDISGNTLNKPVSIQNISAFKDENEYLMQLNTFILIKQINEQLDHLEVIGEIAGYNDVDLKMDEILKIIKKDLNELADYNYPTDHYNIAEIFCNLGMDHLAIKVLEEDDINDHGTSDLIGRAYQGLGEYKKALENLNKSLADKQKLYGEKHVSIAQTLNSIGLVYQELANFNEAIKYHEKALETQKIVYNDSHQSIAVTHEYLGLALQAIEQYEKALQHHFAGLEIKKATLGVNHSSTSTNYDNIAYNYDRLDKIQSALQFWLRSLEIKLINNSETSVLLAPTYNNIGRCYQQLNNSSSALVYYQKALTINQKILGENNFEIIQNHQNLVSNYKKLGQYDQVLEHQMKTLEITRYSFGENNSQIVNTYCNIAESYQAMGQFQEAIAFLQKALEITIQQLGKGHEQTAIILDSIGGNYQASGKYQEALHFQTQALEIKKKKIGLKNKSTALTLNNIGKTYQKLGKLNEALEYYLESLNIKKEILGYKNKSTGLTFYNIGNVYQELENYQDALLNLQLALEIQKQSIGEVHPETAKTYNNIGLIYEVQKLPYQALKYYQSSLSIKKKVLGPTHQSTKITQANIASLIKEIEMQSK